jgi:hypothetical protein
MKHNHEEGFECEACKTGVEAVLEKEKKLIEDYGWYAHYVPGSDEFPFGINMHTHGVAENFDHPDLQICVNMNPHSGHSIISDVIKNIKDGKKYVAGEKYGELIKPKPGYVGPEYKVLFLEAEEMDRKVLRLIFPDVDGTFTGPLGTEQVKGCVIPDGLKL